MYSIVKASLLLIFQDNIFHTYFFSVAIIVESPYINDIIVHTLYFIYFYLNIQTSFEKHSLHHYYRLILNVQWWSVVEFRNGRFYIICNWKLYILTRYPEDQWFHVYTDGSLQNPEGAGAGITCKLFSFYKSMGKNTTHFDGEITVINIAIQQLTYRIHHLKK